MYIEEEKGGDVMKRIGLALAIVLLVVMCAVQVARAEVLKDVAYWDPTAKGGAGATFLVDAELFTNQTVLGREGETTWYVVKGEMTNDQGVDAYDANGGSGAVPVEAPRLRGQEATVLDPGGLSRPGYSGNGWNTRADGSGTPH